MEYSDDEKKVIEYNKNVLRHRAAFFNEAAKRHPAFAQNFNALADATREMTKLIAPEREDKKCVDSVAAKYGPNLVVLMKAAQQHPELLQELTQSQLIAQREFEAFDTLHPELIPARNSLKKKLQP